MRLTNEDVINIEKYPKHKICSNILNKKIPGLKIMGDLNKAYIINYKHKFGSIVCKQTSPHSKESFIIQADYAPERLHAKLKPIKYTLTQINKNELKSGDLYFGFSEVDIIWHHNYWGLNVETFVEEYIKHSKYFEFYIYIGNDYSITINPTENRIEPNTKKYFIRINLK